VLVVTRVTGAVVFSAAGVVGTGTGVPAAGIIVVDVVVVDGCAGADEAHPAENAVTMRSPQIMPIKIMEFVSRFMMDLSITECLQNCVKYLSLFFLKINFL
jgi:hypothetical protein